ncbi:hypothetical protein KFL_000290420 [Klebsormidium nitens]|uniref:Rhodanese domain-containing protein n=1 Tax=Klebsormidium nitens TaxID=105231 RepID=A0A1Y1HNS1_KLENI|nr:hypothetical protein KFL_000290420 [Klebsormidium nitens]|eukprot:GAQ79392.1 hypothetical protein KFL_000290420 [Klebsormidium nitens]
MAAASLTASVQSASKLSTGCRSQTARTPLDNVSSAYVGARLPRSITRGARRRSVARQGAAVAELRSINASEVPALIAEGYKVIDVRDEKQYEKAHIKNSEHVPLFVENTAMDPSTLVLRLLHNNYVGLLYGNAFTKPNPDFNSKISQYPKDQKLLLVCQEGLRSGQAADDLEDKGWAEVAFIAKGLNDIKPGVVEKAGPRELKDAGKGGISQYQQPVSIVVGSILINSFARLVTRPQRVISFDCGAPVLPRAGRPLRAADLPERRLERTG